MKEGDNIAVLPLYLAPLNVWEFIVTSFHVFSLEVHQFDQVSTVWMSTLLTVDTDQLTAIRDYESL